MVHGRRSSSLLRRCKHLQRFFLNFWFDHHLFKNQQILSCKISLQLFFFRTKFLSCKICTHLATQQSVRSSDSKSTPPPFHFDHLVSWFKSPPPTYFEILWSLQQFWCILLQIRPVPTRVKDLSGAPLYCRLLASPTNIRLGWKSLPDKHSSLLRKPVNYGRKKFYNTGPWCQFHQYFMSSFFVWKFFAQLLCAYNLCL